MPVFDVWLNAMRENIEDVMKQYWRVDLRLYRQMQYIEVEHNKLGRLLQVIEIHIVVFFDHNDI